VTSEAERLRFIEGIKRHAEEQLPGLSVEGIEEEVDRHFWPGAVTRLIVGTGAEAHGVLVSRLIFTLKGPTGRLTRGYWGVDRESDLPDDDRQENPILNITLRRTHSLHATYTADTISTALFDSRNV
jgi:hypothetical protein